jgi:hypothetical protein
MTPEDAQRGGEEWGRYKLRPRMTRLGSLLISHGVGAVLSPNRGRIVGALEKWEIKTSCPPRESLTAPDDLPESLSVVRVLRNWFAEVPSLTSPIIHCQCNMVRSDRASDRWPADLDCLHGSPGRGVFEYYP